MQTYCTNKKINFNNQNNSFEPFDRERMEEELNRLNQAEIHLQGREKKEQKEQKEKYKLFLIAKTNLIEIINLLVIIKF